MEGVFFLAKTLSCSLDEILDWRESRFYAWLDVAREEERRTLRLNAEIQARAFHDAGSLAELFDDRARKESDEPAEEIIRKAEKVRKLKMREAGIGEIA